MMQICLFRHVSRVCCAPHRVYTTQRQVTYPPFTRRVHCTFHLVICNVQDSVKPAGRSAAKFGIAYGEAFLHMS